ncbi:MAG: sensor histidine kinase, partial [Phycisphaerae bacterium]
MPQDTSKRFTYGTRVAAGVAGLGLVLAASGLILAVRQGHLLAEQQINQARAEAERLTRDLHRRVSQRVTQALETMTDACRRNREAGRPDRDPMGGARRPSWLGDLFYLDHRSFFFWPGSGPRGQDRKVERDPKRDDQLKQLVGLRMSQHLLLAPMFPEGTTAPLQAESLAGEVVVLAYRNADRTGTDPFTVAVSLDLGRLHDSFLNPLVMPVSERIRLVDATAESPAWSEPIAPALAFWALQPTPEFVERARSGVGRHTSVFVVITLLAVTAMMVAVWGLNHVVQREIALTRMKSSFVADVSHELKTPLALIRLFGETLAEGRVKSAEKQNEYYRIITRESTRLTHLINNILDFSRIDAGRKRYKMEPVDVGEVVRSTYESYRYDLDHHKFEHHLSVESSLPQISGDADAVAQVVLNLIGNALKYYDQERYLKVEVARETRRGRHGVLISVQDRGIGIAPEIRRHLFEGFYRAADERVRQRRGAGLGLTLVKHIVDAHGGSIDVESRL